MRKLQTGLGYIVTRSLIRVPQEGQTVLCKQFQSEYQIYKITKVYHDARRANIQVIEPGEFGMYATIMSVPYSELKELSIEDYSIKKYYPLKMKQWQNAIDKKEVDSKVLVNYMMNIDIDNVLGVARVIPSRDNTLGAFINKIESIHSMNRTKEESDGIKLVCAILRDKYGHLKV